MSRLKATSSPPTPRLEGCRSSSASSGKYSSSVDDNLQATVVQSMLCDTRRLGFAAVLAWRLEDEDPKFTFFNGDQPRPAYGVIQAFTGR